MEIRCSSGKWAPGKIYNRKRREDEIEFEVDDLGNFTYDDLGNKKYKKKKPKPYDDHDDDHDDDDDHHDDDDDHHDDEPRWFYCNRKFFITFGQI